MDWIKVIPMDEIRGKSNGMAIFARRASLDSGESGGGGQGGRASLCQKASTELSKKSSRGTGGVEA